MTVSQTYGSWHMALKKPYYAEDKSFIMSFLWTVISLKLQEREARWGLTWFMKSRAERITPTPQLPLPTTWPSVGCRGIPNLLNVFTFCQTFNEKSSQSGNLKCSSFMIMWRYDGFENDQPRPSSKYASLFLTSMTISPQCTSPMFTGIKTRLSTPGLTFSKISAKHCLMVSDFHAPMFLQSGVYVNRE